MKKLVLLFGLVVLAAAAWGADWAVDVAPNAGGKPEGTDSTLELKWDTGTRGLGMAWYTGAGSWVGNDFDISTVSSYFGISTIRMYTSSTWPNNSWEGMRYAVFAFTGGVPGSMLWPASGVGRFYRPDNGSGWVWVDVTVGWTLSTGVNVFCAASEQYYNYPTCDPFGLDNNPTFFNHSWQRYGGSWAPMNGYESYPYKNLMLRVTVCDDANRVSPSSMGRIKALYQ